MRADVLPVAVGDPAVQRRAVLQQLGEHVSRPVDDLAGRHVREHLRLHHVDAGVDGVGEDLAPGRLLQESLDLAVVVDDDDAELQRIGHPRQRDRHEGVVVLVELNQIRQVDIGQRVPGDHQERLVPQRVLGVLHAAGGAEWRLLGRVLQAHAEVLAVAEVVPHDRRQELHGHDGLGEPVPAQQPQHVLHDRAVGHRQHRLGLVGRHRAQPGALAARHHHGFHRCLSLLTARRRGGPARSRLAWTMYSRAAHQYRALPQITKVQPATLAVSA